MRANGDDLEGLGRVGGECGCGRCCHAERSASLAAGRSPQPCVGSRIINVHQSMEVRVWRSEYGSHSMEVTVWKSTRLLRMDVNQTMEVNQTIKVRSKQTMEVNQTTAR